MKHRVVEPELMDDPALGAAEHRAALRGLESLNAMSGAAGAIYRAIRDLPARGRPVRVLDLATGGGDIPMRLARLARRGGWNAEFHACDLSPVAVEYARQRAEAAGETVTFFQLDALSDPIPRGYDVITCSLFLHHLKDHQAVGLLERMAGAVERRIIVNDLVRTWSSLGLVWLATRLATGCKVVHNDGPQSVRAAFTIREFAGLCLRAGLADARIRRAFPCRFVMTWEKKDLTQRH